MRRKQGFTLIELSIVLVIIGLIVGGVLVGQDLIQAAKNRKVISEVDALKVALTTFKLKYNCLPGDCAQAEQFFGTDAAGCSAYSRTTTSTGTCNGDGNKMIGGQTAGTIGPREPFRAMEQLNLAGMISSETLTGLPNSNYWGGAAGINMPKSTAYTTAGYLIMHQQNSAFGGYSDTSGGGVRYWNDTPRQHVVHFSEGGQYFTAGVGADRFISAADAYSIDTKTDDGKPQSGQMVDRLSDSACHSPIDAATAEYSVATDGSCFLLIFGIN